MGDLLVDALDLDPEVRAFGNEITDVAQESLLLVDVDCLSSPREVPAIDPPLQIVPPLQERLIPMRELLNDLRELFPEPFRRHPSPRRRLVGDEVVERAVDVHPPGLDLSTHHRPLEDSVLTHPEKGDRHAFRRKRKLRRPSRSDAPDFMAPRSGRGGCCL